jgi:hypothetical protein
MCDDIDSENISKVPHKKEGGFFLISQSVMFIDSTAKAKPKVKKKMRNDHCNNNLFLFLIFSSVSELFFV